MLNFFKQKQTLIGYWLLLPAILLTAQIGGFLYFGPIKIEDTKASETPPISASGSVLGAATFVRSGATDVSIPQAPMLSDDELSQISAKSFLVYDQTAGDLSLAERNPNLKLSIASLTKLMTGLVAYQYLDFSKLIVINKSGLTSIRPIVNFYPGDQVLTQDVFDAMIVGSCNDAAEVLANEVENLSGQNIIRLMDQKATDLGMTNTSFANPVGFDNAANYSTAGDLQKLIDETQNYAAFTNLGKKTSLDFFGAENSNYHVQATNTLLKDHPDILAIKTGFTQGAQGAMATKVMENNHEIIILVLGSKDREQDTLTLKQLVADRLSW